MSYSAPFFSTSNLSKYLREQGVVVNYLCRRYLRVTRNIPGKSLLISTSAISDRDMPLYGHFFDCLVDFFNIKFTGVRGSTTSSTISFTREDERDQAFNVIDALNDDEAFIMMVDPRRFEKKEESSCSIS